MKELRNHRGSVLAVLLSVLLALAMVIGSVAVVPQTAYAAGWGPGGPGGGPGGGPDGPGGPGGGGRPQKEHRHSWRYWAEDNTIYAQCTDRQGECAYRNNSLTLTVSASDGTAGETYGGLDITDGITEITNTDYSVIYVGTNGTQYYSSDAPTSEGNYQVLVSIGTATARATFRLVQKEKQGINPTLSFTTGWTVGADASEIADPIVSGNPGSGTVTYYVNGEETDLNTIKSLGVGTYTLKASVAETTDYKSGETNTVTFTVSKRIVNLTVSIDSWTKGETVSTPTADGAGMLPVTYYYKAQDAAEDTYQAWNGNDLPAGNYTLKGVVAETENTVAAEATCNFTVSKTSYGFTVSMQGWTYGDTANDPTVPATSLPTGVGTPTYTYYTDDDCLNPTTATGSGADKSGGKPSYAGTYYVKAVIAGNDTYEESTATTSFTISKKKVDATVQAATRNYDGTTDIVVTASVPATTLVNGDSIEISGLTGTLDTKDAGKNKSVTVNKDKASITGTGSQNYEVNIPATTTATVNPKPVTLTWSDETTLYYTGNQQGVTATVDGVVDGDTVGVTYADDDVHEAAAVGQYTAKAAGVDNANYELAATANKTCDWEIVYKDMTGKVSGTKGSNDWYVSEVTVTGDPATQYQISTDGKNWQDELVYTNDGKYPAVTYYLKETATGYISDQMTATFQIDRTNPEGDIEADDSSVKETLNKITFGRLFKDSVKVTISGEDATSGVASIEYQKVSSIDAYDVNGDWTALTLNKDNKGSFTISAEDKAIIYARITDNAGNETIINSDGLVIYKEAVKESGSSHKRHEGGYGDVTLYNVAAADGRFLAGARFALYKSNDEYIGTYTVDKNGMIVLKNIEASTYYFKQVKAADGYAMTYDPIRFAIEDDQAIGIKVKSELIAAATGQTTAVATDTNATSTGAVTTQSASAAGNTNGGAVINTGDESHMLLYGVAAAAAAVLLATWFVLNRRMSK